VGRLHSGVVWQGDEEWFGGWTFVGVWGCDGKEMADTTSVSDDVGGGRGGT
jgi:hypothetical protein